MSTYYLTNYQFVLKWAYLTFDTTFDYEECFIFQKIFWKISKKELKLIEILVYIKELVHVIKLIQMLSFGWW